MLQLTPEVEAVLAGIEIVKTVFGDPEAGCGRDGNPKIAYQSAACARRGILLLSWRNGTVITRADAVYQCRSCDQWHHTVRKHRLPAEPVLAA